MFDKGASLFCFIFSCDPNFKEFCLQALYECVSHCFKMRLYMRSAYAYTVRCRMHKSAFVYLTMRIIFLNIYRIKTIKLIVLYFYIKYSKLY
jgi:hypothetical protein